jgi:predicted Zn finger-like uncharacterized protein
MDIRCEKCQTEYELDEARIKPTGVTVKCTNCGHMFKIRKKGATELGPAAPQSSNQQSVMMPMPRRPATVPPPSPGVSGAPERIWMLRLENGESRSCKELSTLQQWIVSGVATRESLISRNGKTWKRLGDIAELGQYFAIADDKKRGGAREDRNTLIGVGRGIPGVQKTEIDMASIDNSASDSRMADLPLPVPTTEIDEDDFITGERPKTGQVPVVESIGGPRETAKNTAPPAPTGQSGPVNKRAATQPPPLPAAVAAMVDAVESKSSVAQSSAVMKPSSVPTTAASTSGPSGGAPKAATTAQFGGRVGAVDNEPAFTGTPIRRASNVGSAGTVRTEPGSDDVFGKRSGRRLQTQDDDHDSGPVYTQRGSGVGKWVAIFSIAAIVVAGTAMYLLVFRNQEPTAGAQSGSNSVLLGSGAASGSNLGSASITPIDIAAAAPATVAVASAQVDLLGDLADRLQAQEQTLAKLDATLANDSRVLAMRARLATAQAQQLEDKAALLPNKDAEPLRQKSKQLVTSAVGWATKSVKQSPTDGLANLALADVLRLQGKPSKDVTKYLDAGRPAADAAMRSDYDLLGAQLLARDGKLGDARTALAKLDEGPQRLEQTGDVRIRLRAAMVAWADGAPQVAQTLIDSLLAAQPTHVTALALREKLAAAVNTADPLPPESPVANAPKTVPALPPTASNTAGKPTLDTPVTGESYDKLVKRGNDLAEVNCSKAIEFFNKALEQKPNGVEALIGVGYCNLDAKQFATAFSKFRAALVISPRNERALWGIAESYQQQGRKEQAIESYQRYLEEYPSSAAAKRQLERLGAGGAGGANEPPGSAEPAKVPEPAKSPEPAKAESAPSPGDQPTKPTE